MNLENLPNLASELRFTSKRDMLAHLENSFNAVVREYVRIKRLSPIVAHQIDPDPTVRSEKLTYDLVDYAVDIEHATEIALQGRPYLQKAWFQLAADDTDVDPTLAAACIHACGRVYAARGLEPWRYYRRNRYASRRAGR